MSVMLDDEVALGNDNKYKNFIAAIEKDLKQFESSTEWADRITYLARMNKHIENYEQFRSIPKRITVLRRLAECLHPSLPSGVHIKTLEVYETIFRIIERRRLQRDIILYSYGLFSLLPAAALPVKPVLLKLYEVYFLPLGEALNPVLTGFLIGLFSTLEEGADYYDRVIALLDSLANRIDEFYFYTSVWSAIHLVASTRHSAITFILNHFDKRKNIEDQFHLIGLSKETMASAVCACLNDSEHSLVQRSVLDFLVTCLPIHKKQLSKMQLIKIINAMLHILLKRDMSLNRRIYTWFLGTNNELLYFIGYTQEILIESLRNSLSTVSKNENLSNGKTNNDDNKQMTNMANRQSSTWTLTKLIRVLLVLVDKPDVGPKIIESIFLNYLLLVYEQSYQPAKKSTAHNVQEEHNYSETLKTFNILLDTLEPYFIWEFLAKTFDTILTEQPDQGFIAAGITLKQLCGIIDMLLDVSSLESSTDIRSEHLPEMLYRLIKIMNNNIEKLTSTQTTCCIEILMKILKNIIPTDTNHHLSIFYRSNIAQEYTSESNSTDSDTEDEKDCFISHLHSTPVTEQEDSHVIERLLHQMVRTVEKQMYKFSERKPIRSWTNTVLESINHIDKSIKLYKVFFHRFIQTYLIDKNQIPITDQFQAIYSVLQHKTNDNLPTIFNRYQQLKEFDVKLNEDINQYKTAFEDCCKLLIEFCCFSKQSSIDVQASPSKSPHTSLTWKDKSDLDVWLMDLCVLSLCRTEHFHFQTIAISVLTDLFDYTLKRKNASDHDSTSLSLFLDKTDFFRYLIAYLWEYMNEKYHREYNLQATYSLIILHSMLPNNLCEDLICHELSLKDHSPSSIGIDIIEGYKKFFKLWNSTRDLSNITKSFQQCLIHVLSVLKESSHSCLKSMVQQWIYDCFSRGDMCRIFNVLLIMLLHSDTTRISPQRLDSDTGEEVVYDSIFKNSNFESSDRLEITFSLRSLDGNNEDYDDENMCDHDIEWEDSDGGKQSRTTSSANPNEPMQQIKSAPPTTKFPSISSFSQPIISNFLSFSSPVISRTMKHRTPTISTSFNRTAQQSESNPNHSLRSNSIPTDTITSTSINSRDAYILLYTQSYDYTRVILSLNIIERLMDLIPQQLIHTLLITSNIQTSSMSIYNNQMNELFLKHCRIFDLSNDNNNQECQSYLHLLFNTLLIFTYTYQQNSINIQQNYHVHIHSLIVLTRISRDLSTICMDNAVLVNYVVNLLKKVSFQKILLCLFNRMISKRIDFIKIKRLLHHQLIKQYFEQFIELLEEMILLENILSFNDENFIPQSIVHQALFLSTILQCLKQISFIEYHHHIINLVIEILPHSGSALKTLSIRIIEQICRNLCFIVQYHSQHETKTKFKQLSSFDTIDYVIRLIQHLSYICNYCFGNINSNTQHLTQTLCPPQWMKHITVNTTDLADARQIILTKLPSILSSLLYIWKTLSIDQINSIWLGSNIKQIRESIIEFISSLTKSNGVAFIRAVVQCWNERKRQPKSSHDEIQALLNILKNINNYSINDMIFNMNELIQNPSKKTNSVIRCLQFLLAYLDEQKHVSLACWTTLVIMFRECLSQSTSSSVTFLIIKILTFYIKQSPSLLEKRDAKDLQDITIKVLENCNTIVASSLEQTKWLRKNLQVRRSQHDLESTITTDSSNETDLESNSFDFNDTFQSSNSSLMALTILSEYAGKLLDTIYNLTDDKDRVVVPFIQNLVVNVMPFVRTHVLSNALSYRAASDLLMDISQYSYTKKVLRKEVFEQLFDLGFFQVDLMSLRSWKLIVDNMVTNDRSIAFRDLVTRINTVQTGLFVSKEQEYEQRAMLIKRFAFVIYALDKNQSNRNFQAIFDCLSDLLKLPQVPIIHTQMFLLFRVLLLRISSRNFLPFWPLVMSDLIQALLQIEQDIEGDYSRSSIQRMTMNEISLTNNPNISLKMFLYACKLLDILLAMPYSEVDYFQLFRSAFVANHGLTNQSTDNDTFTTFSIRLTKIFEQKFPDSTRDQLPIIKHGDCPLLRVRTISSTLDLFPFFNYLASYENFDYPNEQNSLSDKMHDIETSVLEDFIELWI